MILPSTSAAFSRAEMQTAMGLSALGFDCAKFSVPELRMVLSTTNL